MRWFPLGSLGGSCPRGGRGLLASAVLSALVWTVSPGRVSADQTSGRDASKAFARGSKLFSAGDYPAAIKAFRRAYQLKPHFLVRCNLALCFEQQSDFIAAAAEYRACLAEGSEKTRAGPRIKRSLSRVEARIAWVSVHSPRAGGMVLVDGKEVGQAPLRVALNPGARKIEVRRDGARPARTTIQVKGGEKLAVELVPIPLVVEPPPPDDPEPPPEPRRRGLSKGWFWGAVGLTAALAATGAVLGVQTLQLRTAFEENPTPDRYDSGVNRRLATNLIFAAAAAAGASATVLYFYTDFSSSSVDQERASAGTSFGIGLRGTF